MSRTPSRAVPPDDVTPRRAATESRQSTRSTRTWRELRRLMGASYDTLDRALRSGTSGSLIQFEALDLLADAGISTPVRQSVLQDGLQLSQSGVSRLMSRLQSAGFIKRVPSPEDARTTLVALTETGRRARNSDRSTFEAQFRHELDSISHALGRPSNVEAGAIQFAPADPESGAEPIVLPFGESDLAGIGSADRTAEALVLREVLEPMVLLDAARNHRKRDIIACKAIVAEMGESLADPMAFFHADWRLHRRLLQVSTNEILKQLYDSLLTFIESTLTEVVENDQLENYLARRLQVHENLVDAVASRNRDLVQYVAREHAFTSRTVEFLDRDL